jgi:mono/diheme cytochrome c family protein
MPRGYVPVVSTIMAVALVSSVAARSGGSAQSGAASSKGAQVARGKYLVTTSVCNDCHTPHKLGPNGPEPDMTRMLSGHPSDMQVPPPPAAKGPWIWGGAATMTAFYGPWGVSFTANLTPDKETGLGNWTEEQFIMALRTGRHEGKGRPILPPMPYQYIGQLSDEDLKAVFAYLQSIPPVHNKVPSPIDPPEELGR